MRVLLVLISLVFSGVALAAPPCRAPSDVAGIGASLPRFAAAIAAGQEPVVVALGSSSTEGVGASDATRSYPSRLAVEMRERHGVPVKVLNKGVGGEVTADMVRRLERDVLAHLPALVIWQAGANSVLKGVDPRDDGRAMADGLARMKEAGVDVVLMDPQYAPRVLESPRHAEIVAGLDEIAESAGAGVFHRFEIMRSWHEAGVGFEETLSSDGLHMNDWSYGCVAKLLADSLAEAIGRRTVPPTAMALD